MIIWFHQLYMILLRCSHPRICAKKNPPRLHDRLAGCFTTCIGCVGDLPIWLFQRCLVGWLHPVVTRYCLVFRGKIIATWMFFWEGIWSFKKWSSKSSQVYPKVVLPRKDHWIKLHFSVLFYFLIWISIRSFRVPLFWTIRIFWMF